MQFHLNGFRLGDPGISELEEGSIAPAAAGPMPDEVDVLIVGCGPAGLTLAAQLSAFPEIRTRIVDQLPGRLRLGQADGIACRTMEMFQAFGFSERVLKEAYWVSETVFWKPDTRHRDNIVRSGRIQDTEDGLSEFPHVILNQARVHDFLLDRMRNSAVRLEPDYSRRMTRLSVTPSPVAKPVTVTLERLDQEHEGQFETVRARFVVGCDGARSAVRASLGLALHGDSGNQAWGVMDILAVTDFPDIRLKTTIHSAKDGNVLIIPREGGYLVRLYVELDKLNENERVASRNITADQLVAAARRILHPYTLDVKEIAWWSVYEIGQRLCDRFDDVPEQDGRDQVPHVFIAGDACHTHSPKAGQGMNVSMQDGFNLGWKLASVITGRCSPQILHSYSTERRAVAQELIDFDRTFAKMFSAAPTENVAADGDGVDPLAFQQYFVKQGRFTAGTATRYAPSLITGKPTHQNLARNFVIGMRFQSAPVIRLADAKPLELGHMFEADGRWRVLIFSDVQDSAAASSALTSLCEFLAESPSSPVKKNTPEGADIDSVIDVRAVFQKSHRELAIDSMPAILRPRKGRYSLCDYEKLFCAHSKVDSDIFEMRGIDRGCGCVVIVRPDQYVANIFPMDAHPEIAAFFDGFMTGSS